MYVAQYHDRRGKSPHDSDSDDLISAELDSALSGTDESGAVAKMLKCSGRRFRSRALDVGLVR
eukprot:2651580-Pyramimonas_sp.AAC.1